jgi:hypothetical protein
MLQFGAPLTHETCSVNYDRKMFIIQATGLACKYYAILKLIDGLVDNFFDIFWALRWGYPEKMAGPNTPAYFASTSVTKEKKKFHNIFN